MARAAELLLLCALLGCGGNEPGAAPRPTSITDISMSSVQPGVVVPGTKLVLSGNAFVPDFAGSTTLHLDGIFGGATVTMTLPARFVDYDRMEVDWPGALAAGLPAEEGQFQGSAFVAAQSSLDGLKHLSSSAPVMLDIRGQLQPRLDALDNGVAFVNDLIVAYGEGFLLGGDEGQTHAVVEGCFTPEGQTGCAPVTPTEVLAEPADEFDRTRVVFPFSPYIAGINPGSFTGSVRLVNRHGALAGGLELTSDNVATDNVINQPLVSSLSPAAASLGQYVDINGGGFIGTSPGEDPSFAVTTIELDGSFTPTGGSTTPASVTLVPEFVSGQLVRYVLNEDDDLGQSVDLRTIVGSFVGTARPVTQFGSDTVAGSAANVSFDIAHVKQVVWLNFLPQYVESLRRFGLRAVDQAIRDRIVEVVQRDYAGVNLELRLDRPTDFALYSQVEIGGPDPNGIGLLGYDNTPGKDAGNLRLYDKIGGVNALTQLDGYPGYGGIFVESLFIFSEHPGTLAIDNGSGHALFDDVFDPFRPDLDGKAVTLTEVDTVPIGLGTGVCPAADRSVAIACAISVLGNLIGTTLSHEIAHSLGLADPGGFALHNGEDFPNALMDAGADRSFPERAELQGEGPGALCQHNYDYLRQILPTNEPDPLPIREACY